ncbi:MAG TPA: ribonuclease H-like domain-containing protein [Vicinamibacterales bacterium]|nr:ribonuclease H-like domain-containing protein [Vicinamibacterales bacterium]
MATLDRLRDIVKHHRSSVPVVSPAVRSDGGGFVPREGVTPRRDSSGDIVNAAIELGGAVVERADGAVIVVEREYHADMIHGRTPIGEIVSTITDGDEALGLMAKAWPAFAPGATAGKPPEATGGRLLFLDLETTGLFSGAGTQAFLIGCAAIDGTSIRIRQFLLPGFEHERALLGEMQAWAKSHGALCTYNGRTFDVPLIETRFMFHRVPCPLDGVPHLDMLHPARRMWRQRPLATGTPDPDDSSCSLGVLEKQIAGLHRVGDVPGYEIPSRFFKFVHTGDARPLEAVMEHNRLDLISLAAVLARAIVLITRGPSAAVTAQEAYGLARVYERGGEYENAEASLLKTIEFAKRVGAEPEVHGEALRRLAWVRRRDRRPHDAAEAWNELAVLPRCAAALRREAKEALAIHQEHRLKDLRSARQHALDLLAEGVANRARLQHRLDRLERKLARYDHAMLPLN